MKNFDFLTISPIKILECNDAFEKEKIFLDENYKEVFGKNPILIIKEDIFCKFIKKIEKFFSEKNIIKFYGECSKIEIKRIEEFLKNKGISSIIGLGGGKVIDTAKVVANDLNVKIIIIPTSSAQGAASSSLSTIYHEDGTIDECRDIVFKSASDLVIIDYSFLMDEPEKFLVFGMADSLAKYYESYAFSGGTTNNIFIQVALNLAKFIKNEIFLYGKKGLNDFKNKNLSVELKNIFKINLVLAPMVGGIGGEGCRICISHAVNNSLTQIKRIRDKKFMHGEQVAFGNLLQLFLDKRDVAKDELVELINLYKRFGLMQDFLYFGEKLDDNEKKIFIDYIFSDTESLRNMPNKVLQEEMLFCMKYFNMI